MPRIVQMSQHVGTQEADRFNEMVADLAADADIDYSSQPILPADIDGMEENALAPKMAYSIRFVRQRVVRRSDGEDMAQDDEAYKSQDSVQPAKDYKWTEVQVFCQMYEAAGGLTVFYPYTELERLGRLDIVDTFLDLVFTDDGQTLSREMARNKRELIHYIDQCVQQERVAATIRAENELIEGPAPPRMSVLAGAIEDVLRWNKRCAATDTMVTGVTECARAATRLASARNVIQSFGEGFVGMQGGEEVVLDGELRDGSSAVDVRYLERFAGMVKGALGDLRQTIEGAANVTWPDAVIVRAGVAREYRDKVERNQKIKPVDPASQKYGKRFRHNLDKELASLSLRVQNAVRDLPQMQDYVEDDADDHEIKQNGFDHLDAGRTYLYRIEGLRTLIQRLNASPVAAATTAFGIPLLLERLWDLRLLVAHARHLYADTRDLEQACHECIFFICAVTVAQDPEIWMTMWLACYADRMRPIYNDRVDRRYRHFWTLLSQIADACFTAAYFGIRHKVHPTNACSTAELGLDYIETWRLLLVSLHNGQCAQRKCSERFNTRSLATMFVDFSTKTVFSRCGGKLYGRLGDHKGWSSSICQCPSTLWSLAPLTASLTFAAAIATPSHFRCKVAGDKVIVGDVQDTDEAAQYEAAARRVEARAAKSERGKLAAKKAEQTEKLRRAEDVKATDALRKEVLSKAGGMLRVTRAKLTKLVEEVQKAKKERQERKQQEKQARAAEKKAMADKRKAARI